MELPRYFKNRYWEIIFLIRCFISFSCSVKPSFVVWFEVFKLFFNFSPSPPLLSCADVPQIVVMEDHYSLYQKQYVTVLILLLSFESLEFDSDRTTRLSWGQHIECRSARHLTKYSASGWEGRLKLLSNPLDSTRIERHCLGWSRPIVSYVNLQDTKNIPKLATMDGWFVS